LKNLSTINSKKYKELWMIVRSKSDNPDCKLAGVLSPPTPIFTIGIHVPPMQGNQIDKFKIMITDLERQEGRRRQATPLDIPMRTEQISNHSEAEQVGGREGSSY
jgi:hypothetical protein